MTNRQSQCQQCHRFLVNAPNPEVGHQGVPGGTLCSLPHHPQPCPWTYDSGEKCAFYQPPVSEVPVNVSESSGDSEDGGPVLDPASLQQEVLQLRQQQQEDSRRLQLLQLANSNLMQNQERLTSEWNVRSSSAFPSTTTTTLSTVSSMPCQGWALATHSPCQVLLQVSPWSSHNLRQ